MNSPGTPLTATPRPHERILALDGLRGLAVIGIAMMNVIAFAMPAAAYVNPRVFGGDGPLEATLWAISFVLVEDKFRALFAMLFGAGVTILLEKASEHPLRHHFARMAVLLGIAMAHAVLFSNNDVLRVYAIAGLALPLAVRWPARVLVWSAAAIMAAQLAVSGWYAWDWLAYWFDRAGGALVDPAPQQLAEATYGPNPQALADASARNAEGLGERAVRRFGEWPQQLRFVAASLPSAFAAMLIGMALWKNGLLAGQWARSRALGLAVRCGLVALPVLVALAAWSIGSGFDPIIAPANALIWSAPFDMLLGVSWAALAMAVLGEWRGARLLAHVGRMSLTNYLTTSIVFAAIFAGWGLSWFAQVSRGEALLLALVPIALMLAWSPLWLVRFRHGPAEWLWRWLANGGRH